MSYVTHAGAALNPAGRLKIAQLVINDGWVQARVAERFQVARGTVSKWVARYRAEGEAGLQDRSSRPFRSPIQTDRRTERRIIALRVTRRWGPHRIGYHLRLPQSTVSKVLTRYRVPLQVTHRTRPQRQWEEQLRAHEFRGGELGDLRGVERCALRVPRFGWRRFVSIGRDRRRYLPRDPRFSSFPGRAAILRLTDVAARHRA